MKMMISETYIYLTQRNYIIYKIKYLYIYMKKKDDDMEESQMTIIEGYPCGEALF